MVKSEPKPGRYCIFALVTLIVVLIAALIAVVILWQQGKSDDADNTTTAPTQPPVVTTPSPKMSSSSGDYRFAAIASAAEPCPSVGVEIIAKYHGSAVDAAIATMLCVGVVNMHSSGIGGGHFMTIYEVPNNGSTEQIMNTILARERAPLAATQDMYVNPNVSSLLGGKAIGVPGEVKGFHKSWLKFGRAPWDALFQPAIKLAKTGFYVNKHLSNAIVSNEKLIKEDPILRSLLVKADGNIAAVGDTLKRPKYARTLEILSQDPNALYNSSSSLAQDMIADIQDYGGIISLQDMVNYQVYDKDPISVNLPNGNFKVFGPKPPSSGVVFQYILNILDGYNFSSSDLSSSQKTVLTYHRIVEAFKFAFAKRSELGDEGFVSGLEGLLANMTSFDYAKGTRSKIDDSRTYNISYYEPAFEILSNSGTSHCSIVTPDGSAVAITSTINYYFGSKVIGNRTGIVFNNEMDDFSTPGTVNGFGVPASPANYIKPGKMPMSSMCPTIVLDKDNVVRLVSGASGGTRITTATAYVSLFTLWMGMNASMATDLPRMHHQLSPNQLMVEPDFSKELIKGLEALGHEVVVQNKANVHTVHNTCTERTDYVTQRNDNCVHAVVDRRKGGKPDGF